MPQRKRFDFSLIALVYYLRPFIGLESAPFSISYKIFSFGPHWNLKLPCIQIYSIHSNYGNLVSLSNLRAISHSTSKFRYFQSVLYACLNSYLVILIVTFYSIDWLILWNIYIKQKWTGSRESWYWYITFFDCGVENSYQTTQVI